MESEAVAALLGAVIGGTLTIIGNLVHESWRDARQAERLAHGIAGEVAALIEIIEKRGYLKGIREFAEVTRAGQVAIFQVRVTRNYFPVTEASLDSIGLLPAELPILIPRFLTLAKSVLEDLDAFASGYFNDLDAVQLTERYDELAEVFEAALKVARELVAVVASMYGSPHGRYPLGSRVRLWWWRLWKPRARDT